MLAVTSLFPVVVAVATIPAASNRIGDEMNKCLHMSIIVLMFRIDWRKLLFVGTSITLTGILLQISTLPYPLTRWTPPPPLAVSSQSPFNGTIRLSETSTSLAQDEQFESVVLLNHSAEFNQPVRVLEEGKKVSQQSIRSKAAKPEVLVTLPTHSHINVPGRLLRHIRSLTSDEALIYAKKEIESASLVTSDPDLYAPLFRNLSVFKRSYELMEVILKVYIYHEGKRPIFHQPQLKGIYSSEGWFMKLMQGNRQFITTDPEKAHLFYLPYSVRQLQLALYVQDSHDIKPLKRFLRNYVIMLSSKYPFWNRHHGSDHFFVACHDWGPYTVTEHEELTKNTIKALCNADLSEGIFVTGKDVSLPETTIRNPRKPLRDLGGKRASQRSILAFFAGRMHGRVRPLLLKYWGNKDEDMKIYRLLPNRVSRNMSYAHHMKSSKYCICPMGYEVNSPRIVEAIYYECVPVIIADNFVPPLDEVLDWSAFSVIVAEKDLLRLKEILIAIPLRRYLTMQTNVKMLQKHFHWNPRPVRYDMFHMILHSIWFNRLSQIQMPQQS
ncbi:hypothetical protein RJ640_012885 [Escallonia rubra]|uniref:Exostosin GT47 domain-containing protein n=1 Tax=Escallonia rubra TaxID=112253 RepID=A0AA88UFU6_9ASTE|nr:hypothetical protein RJ640_012885 [Escallonia rubra]